MATTLPTSTRDGICDYVVDLIDAGAGPGTLVFLTSGDVEVATLTFSSTAFGDSSSGTATANTITDDTSATGGLTTKAELRDSDNNVVLTCSVGTSGEDINLTNNNIGAGVTVGLTSLTVTVPAS